MYSNFISINLIDLLVERLIVESENKRSLEETVLQREFVLAYESRLLEYKDSFNELDILKDEIDKTLWHPKGKSEIERIL